MERVRLIVVVNTYTIETVICWEGPWLVTCGTQQILKVEYVYGTVVINDRPKLRSLFTSDVIRDGRKNTKLHIDTRTALQTNVRR